MKLSIELYLCILNYRCQSPNDIDLTQ